MTVIARTTKSTGQRERGHRRRRDAGSTDDHRGRRQPPGASASITPAGRQQALARLGHLRRRWSEIQPSDEARDGAERLLGVHTLRAADAPTASPALAVRVGVAPIGRHGRRARAVPFLLFPEFTCVDVEAGLQTRLGRLKTGPYRWQHK
jgi:hypothetical protein